MKVFWIAILLTGALMGQSENFRRGLELFQQGHFEEARKAGLKALEFVPHHAPTHALLAKISIALREYDEARYHLQRALATDPLNASASRLLAKMGRGNRTSLIAGLGLNRRELARWLGPIFIVIILVVIALSVLLSR